MIKSFSDIINKRKQFRNLPRSRGKTSIFDFLQLVDNWDKVAGKAMAKYTIPFKLQNGILFITSSHPAFAQEASFNQKALIAKIKSYYPDIEGKIKRIYFKLDEITFATLSKQKENRTNSGPAQRIEKETPHRHSPEYQLAEKEAIKIVKDVEDEEIRELLKTIYIQQKLND